jgi:(2Fe-2S) ferredoxin
MPAVASPYNFHNLPSKSALKSIIVCVNHRANPNQPSCGARGGVEIAELAEAEVTRRGLNIRIEQFNCLGFCDRGPNLKIAPDGGFIYGVKPEDIPLLIQKVANTTDD